MAQPKYTPCLEPNCDEYAIKAGRCGLHYVPFKGSTRKQRLPKDWAARRNQVLIRDKGICYLCGAEGADSVDHIDQSLEDDHSFANLAACHLNVPPYCHRTKTAYEGNRAKGLPF